MPITPEDITKFVSDNLTVIAITLIVIALIYVNIKINDLEYRLLELVINSDSPLKTRTYRNRDWNYR